MLNARDLLRETSNNDGLVQSTGLESPDWDKTRTRSGDVDSEGDCPGHSEGHCPGHSEGDCPGDNEGDCPGDSEGDCPGNPEAYVRRAEAVCIRHAIAVREHTASWLGMAIVGGYIALTMFVAGRAAFMASSEAELMQVLERLNQNFGAAIGFVLGYYFAIRANGSSKGLR